MTLMNMRMTQIIYPYHPSGNPRISVAMYRKEKINSILIHEIGDILLKEMEFPLGVLVTVTNAEATDDLKEAKVFVSVLPFKESRRILEILGKNIYHIQQFLNKRLRMKPVPKISFKIDPSIEQADKVERLLKND